MSRFSKDDKCVADLDLASLDINTKQAHADFGIVLSLDYPILNAPLPKGWVRHLVERYGVVVIPKQHQFIKDPALFVATIQRILAEPTSSANEDLATIEGLPQVQILGSPNSAFAPTATFIPAREAETPDSLLNWLDNTKPCSVTDWHSDEPWEDAPVKFTIAFSAKSTGPNATLFTSTSALYERTSDDIKETLDYSKTTFAPPPWLPSENTQACHSTVQRGPNGNSFYICMDSTKGIDAFEGDDRKAKEVIWNLTKSGTQPENIYTHNWEEGDLVIWDNTRTLHARSPYKDACVDRVLYRMRVFGKKEDAVVDGKATTRIVCVEESDDNAAQEEKKQGEKSIIRKMMRRRSSANLQ